MNVLSFLRLYVSPILSPTPFPSCRFPNIFPWICVPSCPNYKSSIHTNLWLQDFLL
jgi:hypothetical protein